MWLKILLIKLEVSRCDVSHINFKRFHLFFRNFFWTFQMNVWKPVFQNKNSNNNNNKTHDWPPSTHTYFSNVLCKRFFATECLEFSQLSIPLKSNCTELFVIGFSY